MPQFLGSSVVEQLAVNQLVVGSNPTRGAIFQKTYKKPFNGFLICRKNLNAEKSRYSTPVIQFYESL